MFQIAIIYHSGYGHTAKVAEAVEKGAKGAGALTHLLKADILKESDWEILDKADGIIFGAPTYMAGVSAQFKTFIDATSKRWMTQSWKNKIAGGFTNSASYSGDKLASIQQLFHLAMQHGMIWVGQAEVSPSFSDNQLPDFNDLNRVGSYSGLMTQANHTSSAEIAPPKGDIETASLYGKRIADMAMKLAKI